MNFCGCQITEDLKSLGLKNGDSVVVHSSYKSIGLVDGGPHAVIEALMETVLPDGALLFPNLNITHEFTKQKPPRFDLKEDSLKNTTGIMPEIFKFEYAEHFSIHPTHSMMGTGEMAPDILKEHDKAGVPCGKDTPWEKNALSGGKILLIGVDQSTNTTCHTAEEQIEDPYKLSEDIIDGIVVVDGEELIIPSRLHIRKYHADFNIINAELESRDYMRTGRIGNASALLIDAAAFVELCLDKMRHDKKYFL